MAAFFRRVERIPLRRPSRPLRFVQIFFPSTTVLWARTVVARCPSHTRRPTPRHYYRPRAVLLPLQPILTLVMSKVFEPVHGSFSNLDPRSESYSIHRRSGRNRASSAIP